MDHQLCSPEQPTTISPALCGPELAEYNPGLDYGWSRSQYHVHWSSYEGAAEHDDRIGFVQYYRLQRIG